MESFNALISARRTFAERTSPRPTWRERASAAPTWSGRTSARPTWRQRPSGGPTWRGRTSSRPTWREPTSEGPTWSERTSGGPTWSERTSARPTSRERTSLGPTSRERISAGPTWRERISAGPTWRERTSAGPTWRQRLMLPRQDPPRKSPPVAGSSDLHMKSEMRAPWLFFGGDGGTISPRAFRQKSGRRSRGGGSLRYRKPPALRHTYASLLIQGGGAISTQPARSMRETDNERDRRSRSRKDSTRLLPAGVKLLR